MKYNNFQFLPGKCLSRKKSSPLVQFCRFGLLLVDQQHQASFTDPKLCRPRSCLIDQISRSGLVQNYAARCSQIAGEVHKSQLLRRRAELAEAKPPAISCRSSGSPGPRNLGQSTTKRAASSSFPLPLPLLLLLGTHSHGVFSVSIRLSASTCFATTLLTFALSIALSPQIWLRQR